MIKEEPIIFEIFCYLKRKPLTWTVVVLGQVVNPLQDIRIPLSQITQQIIGHG